MCNEETKVIDMSLMINKFNNQEQKAEMLQAHSRTMIMMFNATGEVRYLDRSVRDLISADDLLQVGFVRPLGVLQNKAA